ncbi:DUF488 domain-containing protein [Tatumella ptyseos]|uniref:DUF488 domain-containing protein n=1 Tax=Tatumella ptyseos TaxID=82987 RepID=UPI0023EFBFA4|nr:DUF488 family protein [Tatumella ptyseos]
MITFKRVYEPAAGQDGWRVLADRLWPRGVSKSSLTMDEWCRDITPSAELWQAYHHQLIDFQTFGERYLAELTHPEAEDCLRRLALKASTGNLTLLSAVKSPQTSHIPWLTRVLEQHIRLLNDGLTEQ